MGLLRYPIKEKGGGGEIFSDKQGRGEGDITFSPIKAPDYLSGEGICGASSQ